MLFTVVKSNIEFVKEVEFEKKAGEKWIGLISDTHMPSRTKDIPPKVFEIFRKVDLIIHAGDFVSIDVLRELEKRAPVIGVHGNMDFGEVRSELPEINYVEILGRKIGVVHDAGIFGTEKMKRIARENNFDILVFGHTHRQFLMEDEGRIFINPGSPTNPLPPFLIKPSIALLKIDEKKVEVFFVEI
ncbi:MAG: metallophosphoesterase [Candidatus Aenigmarchaeota archaeon]|nr:metallophosphoesterase [Candidatus Aenigmarchaeota archaeon]